MNDLMSRLLGVEAARFAQQVGWDVVPLCDDPLEGHVFSDYAKVTVTRVSLGAWEAYGPDGHVFDFRSQWELLSWMNERL